MKNGVVIGVISVFIAIVVIGSVLVPVIDSSTKTTTVIDNEGAVGLRMDKVTSGDFTLTYGLVGDDFTATNGTDAQIIDDTCIFYADDNVAVWMDDSSVRMLGKDANDQTIDAALSDDATITITKSADGVNITDGTIDQTFPVPAWSYVPKSTGAYGFFLNETEVKTGGLDVHYVGSFAGVNCYDSINTYDLPITLDATVTDSILTGAKWIKSAADTETELSPLEPGSLTPLDPGVISLDPEPDASIMAVPTPTYTDGDWGYDLITTGDNAGKAKIVSYSGTGGDIIVPATIGGYDVAEFGKGSSINDVVFNNNSLSAGSSLTFTDGIKIINKGACDTCINFTGSLKLPETLTLIDQNAFYYCKFTGALVIPNTVTQINANAFNRCTGFTSLQLSTSLSTLSHYVFDGCSGFTGALVIPENIETINNNAFRNCSGFTGALVIPDSVTFIGDSSFNGCSGFTNVIVPDSVTTIGSAGIYGFLGSYNLVLDLSDSATIANNAFGYSNYRNVLNLGTLSLTENRHGLSSDATISDNVPALGYLAPTQFKETVTEDGPVAALLNAIPLIAIIAVVMMAVGVFIAHRTE